MRGWTPLMGKCFDTFLVACACDAQNQIFLSRSRAGVMSS